MDVQDTANNVTPEVVKSEQKAENTTNTSTARERQLSGLKPFSKDYQPTKRPGRRGCNFADVSRKMLASKKIEVSFSYPTKDGAQKKTRIYINADKNFTYALVAALIREGMAGNVQAIRELLDRTIGKAPQEMNLTNAGGKFESMTTEQLTAYLAGLLSQINEAEKK